jgi:hypothetical protein
MPRLPYDFAPLRRMSIAMTTGAPKSAVTVLIDY